jgi:hypothetical protein
MTNLNDILEMVKTSYPNARISGGRLLLNPKFELMLQNDQPVVYSRMGGGTVSERIDGRKQAQLLKSQFAPAFDGLLVGTRVGVEAL